MTLRTTLARLARRDPDRPTIRERLAAGKVRLARLTRRPETAADADAGRRAVMGGALAAAVPLPALGASSDLARACAWAIKHQGAVNRGCVEQPSAWTDARITAELDRYHVVFRRAVDEPSASLGDIKAKASLLLNDLIENSPLPDSDEEPTDDERLTHVVLAEIVAL